ncbi:hypothetical protein FHS19_006314 [Paenibacillus rhizosphaerae]|uniref:Uncharacterized protein n=1 Tax=Paenibacillus rhizosphaerae TaxID=297318 RepID=A0A839TYP6_9BACL|nr:hypothetical protein [Paenibacillus rhizosphaerae]
MFNNRNALTHWKRLAAVMTLSALLLTVSQNVQAQGPAAESGGREGSPDTPGSARTDRGGFFR